MDGVPFELHEDEEGPELRLAVRGELDIATAARLDARLAALADARRATLLDLRGLTFMDSSGLRSLMLARERSASNGWELRIVAPTGDAAEVLRISGVASHLPLVSDP